MLGCARFAPPSPLASQGAFPIRQESRRYKLIKVWYLMPVSSAICLKYSTVDSSNRMVTDRFSLRAYGFFRAFGEVVLHLSCSPSPVVFRFVFGGLSR